METAAICTTCLTVNNREALKVRHQRLNDGTNRGKKLVTKISALSSYQR